MHEEVIKIPLARLLVLARGEARKSILIQINTQRIDAVDENVESQVVLQAVDEVRLLKVALGDHLLLRRDTLPVARQEDSLTLAGVLWLKYVYWGGLRAERILSKVFVLQREHVRPRKEVVVRWQQRLHLLEVSAEHVLSGEVVDAWIVVNSLIVVHVLEDLDADGPIEPRDVPIGLPFLC